MRLRRGALPGAGCAGRGPAPKLLTVKLWKTGKVPVGDYYEILRPATRDELDKAGPAVAAVLEGLPPRGYVSAAQLKGRARDVERALKWACDSGIARPTKLKGRAMEFESVRFWVSQLNSPKMKNVKLEQGTRYTYVDMLDSFDRWLRGTELPAGRGGVPGGPSRTFESVEELLRFCEDSDHGVRTAKRAVRQYLVETAASGDSLSTVMVRASAIRSYFAAHDIAIDVKVNRARHAVHEVRESAEMGLLDLYKLMTAGRMDIMMRAVVMVKFQAGLDASTLADRFNFEAYGQMVKHFGVEDYESWDLDKCPVPIRLVRVKTGMQYTTFIDRDAVSHLRDYLRWRESRHGRHGGSGPLFVTRSGNPVGPAWISVKFSKAAASAGIQRKISGRGYKIRSHEVRDLLKSTLMVSGCAQYAADHVLGHAPRDSYEKQATLYPEALRAEYAKASGRLNIFSRIEECLCMTEAAGGGPEEGRREGGGRYRELEARQREMQEALQKLNGTVTDMLRIMFLSKGGGPDAPGSPRRGPGDPEGGCQ